ncbi:MAG: 50S ribosomal protein L7/L12, partial [Candidatus Eiseniibacteriota bacterium]
MSTSIDQVLDLIGSMTVLELSELKKKYEEK